MLASRRSRTTRPARIATSRTLTLTLTQTPTLTRTQTRSLVLAVTLALALTRTLARYPPDDILAEPTMGDYEYIRPAELTDDAIVCPTPILTRSSPGWAAGRGVELVFTVQIYLGDGRGGRGDNEP